MKDMWGEYTEKLKDLIERASDKDPKKRIKIEEILKHEFLTKSSENQWSEIPAEYLLNN